MCIRDSHSAGDQIRSINSNIPLVVRDFTYDINYPKQNVTHQLARFKSFKKFSENGKLNFQYDFQNNRRFEYDIRVGNDRDKPALDLELKTHSIILDYATNYESLNFKTGIMGRYQENYPNPDTGVRRLIPDYEKYDLGIYSIADYKLKDNWQFEAGIRFDYIYLDVFKFYKKTLWEERGYNILFPDLVVDDLGFQVLTNPVFEFNNFSATAGFTHIISEKSKLFVNHSIASRAPNVSELFSEGLHHSICLLYTSPSPRD